MTFILIMGLKASEIHFCSKRTEITKKDYYICSFKKVTALKSQLPELSSSFCDNETSNIELDEKIISFHACSL